MTYPHRYFTDNYNKNSKLLSEINNKLKKISFYRVILFLVTAIGIYITIANGYPIAALLFSTGIVVFVLMIIKQLRLEKQKKHVEILCKINMDELRLMKGDFSTADPGNEFADTNHYYTDDLDIFGAKSVFQLINRCSTKRGRIKLANRLKEPLHDISQLKKRQDAIAELKDIPDIRQSFQAEGMSFSEKANDIENIISWAGDNTKMFDTIFYRVFLILNPLLAIAIIVMIYFGLLNFTAFLLFMIIPFALIGTKLAVLNKIHNQVSNKTEILAGYTGLFNIVGKNSFNSELLLQTKKDLCGDISASKAIYELSGITKSMDYRLNMIVGIFLNLFLLWDIKQAVRAERWKKEYYNKLDTWFGELALVDELQSFAGFAFRFGDAVFPEFSAKTFEINGKNIRHPLIDQSKCIGNEHIVNGWNEFRIITGANMAGKSTYLRTIGVNIVLALTGSVVLADSYTIYPVKVFTGIKTTDSIQDGESYFFAELKRLKELIDHLEEGEKLYIILDEVLRGTNSADKQKGSMALITQLLHLRSSGIIATHDLALGKLAEKFPGNVVNNRFEVEISDNELVFDYKLKEGISQNLNATFLMKKMGITV